MTFESKLSFVFDMTSVYRPFSSFFLSLSPAQMHPNVLTHAHTHAPHNNTHTHSSALFTQISNFFVSFFPLFSSHHSVHTVYFVFSSHHSVHTVYFSAFITKLAKHFEMSLETGINYFWSSTNFT